MKRILLISLVMPLLLGVGRVWAAPPSPISPDILAACQARVQAAPASADAHFDLAMAYARTAYLEAGWEELKQVNDLDPQYGQKIINRYGQLIKKNPNDIESRFRITFAYYFLNQKDRAIAEHRTILKLNPQYIWSYNYLAYLLAEQGKLDEAIALLQKALAIDPKNAVANFLIGHGYYRQGHKQKAASHIATALRLRFSNPI